MTGAAHYTSTPTGATQARGYLIPYDSITQLDSFKLSAAYFDDDGRLFRRMPAHDNVARRLRMPHAYPDGYEIAAIHYHTYSNPDTPPILDRLRCVQSLVQLRIRGPCVVMADARITERCTHWTNDPAQSQCTCQSRNSALAEM
jgi:hypothetical protein